MGAIEMSHYIAVVMAVQLVGGIPLLAGRYVALALVVTRLWLGTMWSARGAFAPMFAARAGVAKAA
jgi:hypothetical protein